MVLKVRDRSQSLLQALKLDFPSKMRDLDAYLPSYVTFCRFVGFRSCEHLFDVLGCLFHDFVRVAPAGNPLQPISGPCSIEKYSSLRMANRYTRIFDVG